MKILFWILLAFIVLMPGVNAQNTSTKTTAFNLRTLREADRRQIVYSDPYFLWLNARSKLCSAVLVDSALADTAVSGRSECSWTLKVDSLKSRIVYVTWTRYNDQNRRVAFGTTSFVTQAAVSVYQDVSMDGVLDVITFPTDSIASNSLTTINLLRRKWQ